MSAAGNVAAYLAAMRRHNQPALTIGLGLVNHHGRIERNPITLADLQGLLDRLRDVCPDCETCETCGAWLCESCGVGEPVTRCESTPELVHCDHPNCLCRGCARAAGEDARAEAYADLTGGRF